MGGNIPFGVLSLSMNRIRTRRSSAAVVENKVRFSTLKSRENIRFGARISIALILRDLREKDSKQIGLFFFTQHEWNSASNRGIRCSSERHEVLCDISSRGLGFRVYGSGFRV
jgi:hypothetical protein